MYFKIISIKLIYFKNYIILGLLQSSYLEIDTSKYFISRLYLRQQNYNLRCNAFKSYNIIEFFYFHFLCQTIIEVIMNLKNAANPFFNWLTGIRI